MTLSTCDKSDKSDVEQLKVIGGWRGGDFWDNLYIETRYLLDYE